jgi:hypothetical protein
MADSAALAETVASFQAAPARFVPQSRGVAELIERLSTQRRPARRGFMFPATDKWSWFGIAAFLLVGIGVAIGTIAWPRDVPNFADTVIRICAAPFRRAAPEETPFFAQNSAAMSRMMIGMAIEPTGDVDRDFVAMMSAHHQGAIDMAQTLLRYGQNEALQRLAQEIIVTQQQEIAAMRLAVGESLPPIPAPDQVLGQER